MRKTYFLHALLVLLSVLSVGKLFAQDGDHGDGDRPGHFIVSITICLPGVSNSPSGCPNGEVDTQKSILAPDGGLLNEYGGLASTPDEHSTIFPPGTIPGHPDYGTQMAGRVVE